MFSALFSGVSGIEHRCTEQDNKHRQTSDSRKADPIHEYPHRKRKAVTRVCEKATDRATLKQLAPASHQLLLCPFGTFLRFCCSAFVGMVLHVTVRMQQHQIGKVVRTAFRPWDSVMNIPSSIFGDRLVAHGAESFLPPPETTQPPTPAEC